MKMIKCAKYPCDRGLRTPDGCKVPDCYEREQSGKAPEVMDAPEMKTWDIVAVGDSGEPMEGMILRLADEQGVKFKVRVRSKQAITIARGLLGAVVHIMEGKIILAADEFPKPQVITIPAPPMDPSSLQVDDGHGLEIH